MKYLNHQKEIMMSKIFRIIVMAFFMATAATSFAAKDYVKTYEETFTTSRDGSVRLNNRYGNIDITTVSGNEVRIKVEVSVDAKSQDSADDIFDRIDIEIDENRDIISATTTINENRNFWKNLVSWGGNNKYEIRYEVELPAYIYLDITNKYGNISCDDMENDMDIELKYGNFVIGSAHDMDIDLGYGNGELTRAHDIDVEIKYGKLSMNKCLDMDIESKYSKITIDDAAVLDSESKYDHFDIGSVGTFENVGKYDDINIDHVDETVINSKYTKINLEKLGRNADIETSYGSIRIKEIMPELESIEIHSSYANITIDNPQEVGFDFDIHTRYGGISVNEGTGTFDEDGEHEEAEGRRKGEGNGKIQIESSYGKVRIR